MDMRILYRNLLALSGLLLVLLLSACATQGAVKEIPAEKQKADPPLRVSVPDEAPQDEDMEEDALAEEEDTLQEDAPSLSVQPPAREIPAAPLPLSIAQAPPPVRIPPLPPAAPVAAPPLRPPEKTPEPGTPERLMGEGRISASAMKSFFLSTNSWINSIFIDELIYFYIEEAAIEGVNHDVAFAQMCLETGFLRFGGLVTPDMNNFCGLGAIGPEQPGLSFPSPQIGVRAHIQHLKAYATDAPLQQEVVDPRYRYVRYGSAPTIDGLAGTWAADREYARKIRSILGRLYAHNLTVSVADK